MRLSRSAGYAIQALLFLSHQEHDWLSSQRIAYGAGVPEQTLRKLLKALVSAQILASRNGPLGGFRLARPPDEISLPEVLEVIDGPFMGQAGVADGRGRLTVNHTVQAAGERAGKRIRLELQKVKLSHLHGSKR